MNISINNYIHYQGKYIIYEEKGIGKEYDSNSNTDKLIFEGQYLNGIRNGKGIEYYYDKILYDGEYLNGKRNGKGKEYNRFSGNLIFEGEYLNGKDEMEKEKIMIIIDYYMKVNI